MAPADKSIAPDIWGGIECTINRVGDNYMDQLGLSGYYNREHDLDAIIALGVKTIRFPILWEKHQPSQNNDIDWKWATSQLYKLKENGVTPIIGLLHHGSGPSFTNLLEENFPQLFASYAAKVASQFPWVTFYNPINEPLTTARFSGLYGHWYPHHNNDVSFIRILLNELKAIVLAMAEIRKINPDAKLIQTEDLGKTYSTQLLCYQANFENHRRLLTYDILMGKLDEHHALWNYFLRLGIEEEALLFFINNPCPPNVLGVNYYVTSERYLDENFTNYHPATHGSNGLHSYADVEAVRVRLKEPHGPVHLLKEIAGRYNMPIAITEMHLHCTREEQLRWLNDIYGAVMKLREQNVNIVAITAWALLGSFCWNTLLTSPNGEYETGAFDISAGYLRPTAIAAMIEKMARQKCFEHPLLKLPGWWLRNSRYFDDDGTPDPVNTLTQPLMILGENEMVSNEFARQCTDRHIHYCIVERKEIESCNAGYLEGFIKRYQPWAILNTAGFEHVHLEEKENLRYHSLNSGGVQKLASVCNRLNIKLVSFSVDTVFDDFKGYSHLGSATNNMERISERTKSYTEGLLLEACPSSLVIRCGSVFIAGDKSSFINRILSNLSRGIKVQARGDVMISPTYLPHLVYASLNLLIDDVRGVWHLANKGCISWFNFATMAANYTGLNTSNIIKTEVENTAPCLSFFSARESNKYGLMPTLEQALEEYFANQFTMA